MLFNVNLNNLVIEMQRHSLFYKWFVLNQTIRIFNGRRCFLVFVMFSIFIKIRMIVRFSFWSFIMRFICHLWNFSQYSYILCRRGYNLSYSIPSTLFLWCHTHWLLWITSWQHWVSRQCRMTPIDCGERTIWFDAVSLG